MLALSKYEYEILVSERGYNTSENRNWIAAQAVKLGCSHLFFIDDDMVFPEDTLDKLLAHDKDIVGAVYNTKYETPTPVIEWLPEGKPYEDIFLNGSLFECGAIGTGCLLIKCDVFRKVPQIWFNYEWNDNGSVKMSHDWWFCHKARECGFKIWADPTLSIGHLGQHEF